MALHTNVSDLSTNLFVVVTFLSHVGSLPNTIPKCVPSWKACSYQRGGTLIANSKSNLLSFFQRRDNFLSTRIAECSKLTGFCVSSGLKNSLDDLILQFANLCQHGTSLFQKPVPLCKNKRRT